jgi:hypothetical protein
MKYLILTVFFLTCINRVNAQNASSRAPSLSRAVARFDPKRATAALIASLPSSTRNKADNRSEGGYWLLLRNFSMRRW